MLHAGALSTAYGCLIDNGLSAARVYLAASKLTNAHAYLCCKHVEWFYSVRQWPKGGFKQQAQQMSWSCILVVAGFMRSMCNSRGSQEKKGIPLTVTFTDGDHWITRCVVQSVLCTVVTRGVNRVSISGASVSRPEFRQCFTLFWHRT
jgi:hypothetical protein